MNGILSLVTPLLLHMIISDGFGMMFGNVLDATSCTAAASLVVIPIAGWVFLRDRKRETYQLMHGNDISVMEIAFSRKERLSQKSILSEKSGASRKGGKTLEKEKVSVRFHVFCFAMGGIMNLLISALMNLLHITQSFSNQTQEQLLSAQLAVQVVGLVILVPLAEELVFRGLIYSRMKQFFPVKLAIVLSALLFAVYHGNPIQMIFAFPMALMLAAVYERGESLVCPVLFHAGANLTAVLMNLL